MNYLEDAVNDPDTEVKEFAPELLDAVMDYVEQNGISEKQMLDLYDSAVSIVLEPYENALER